MLFRILTLAVAFWAGAALLSPTCFATTLTTLQDGSSMAHAIPIHAPDEKTGVTAEYHWIAEHFPGYKRGGQSLLHDNGRFYDAIDITTANGERRKIFFDITDFFGKM
jgi:hypothetical protein